MPTIKIECNFSLTEIKKIHKYITELKPTEEDPEWIEFDYPDYGGLPDDINKKFTPDQVDYLQDLIHYRKPEFVSTITLDQIRNVILKGM